MLIWTLFALLVPTTTATSASGDEGEWPGCARPPPVEEETLIAGTLVTLYFIEWKEPARIHGVF